MPVAIRGFVNEALASHPLEEEMLESAVENQSGHSRILQCGDKKFTSMWSGWGGGGGGGGAKGLSEQPGLTLLSTVCTKPALCITPTGVYTPAGHLLQTSLGHTLLAHPKSKHYLVAIPLYYCTLPDGGRGLGDWGSWKWRNLYLLNR